MSSAQLAPLVNTFKHALHSHRPQVGMFMGLNNPISAEILATCGFDFLLIDCEHGINDMPTVQAQLQAMAPYPTQVLVRPVDHNPATLKQLLGMGVQTILAPMVDTAAQAEQLVLALHYPPRGTRGVGTGLERGARWNAVTDYVKHAESNTCLVVQIESIQGLDNLEAICAVDGVDGVFIGPSDLAAALGHLGNAQHPDVQNTITLALSRINQQGTAAGLFCGNPGQVAAYRAAGACFMALGADTALLRNAAVQLAATARQNL